MKSKRKTLLLVLTIVLLLAIAGLAYILIKSGKIVPQAAGQGAVLSLSPSTGTFDVGENFNIDLLIDTDSEQVSSVKIKNLHYDSQILELQSVETSSNFQTLSQYQSDPGTLYFIADSDSGFTGQGTVVTIVFKGLTPGGSQLTIDYTPGAPPESDTSWVFRPGIEENYLQSVGGGSCTIDTPPTPTPTITPTQTPSGGGGGGGGGRRTPTPSPTSVETPTPEPTVEPTQEPTPEETSSSEETPTSTPIAIIIPTPTPPPPSPTPGPAQISKLDFPIAPEEIANTLPVIKIAGVSLTPSYIWLFYFGGPILITAGVIFLWVRRKKQKANSKLKNKEL